MTAANRDSAIKVTLGYEGGYSNHPSDPGGPTNWGITLKDARTYWKVDATAADVKEMPIGVAVDIYRRRYWAPLRCDELPAGVDLAVFDYGVNSGIGRSARVLQQIVGVPGDGGIGPETLARVRALPASTIIKDVCVERLVFLQGLRTWPVFGKGWGRRVADVQYRALRMVAGGAPPVKSSPSAVPAAVAVVATGSALAGKTAGFDTSLILIVVAAIVVVGAVFHIIKKAKA